MNPPAAIAVGLGLAQLDAACMGGNAIAGALLRQQGGQRAYGPAACLKCLVAGFGGQLDNRKTGIKGCHLLLFFVIGRRRADLTQGEQDCVCRDQDDGNPEPVQCFHFACVANAIPWSTRCGSSLNDCGRQAASRVASPPVSHSAGLGPMLFRAASTARSIPPAASISAPCTRACSVLRAG